MEAKSVTYRHGKFELHVRPAGDDCVEVILPGCAKKTTVKELRQLQAEAKVENDKMWRERFPEQYKDK